MEHYFVAQWCQTVVSILLSETFPQFCFTKERIPTFLYLQDLGLHPKCFVTPLVSLSLSL